MVFKGYKALWALAIITCLLIAAFTGALVYDLRQQELERSRNESLGLARIYMQQTEQSLGRIQQVVQGVGDRLDSDFGKKLRLDSPEIYLLLATRAASTQQLFSIFVVDEKGRIRNSSIKPDYPMIDVSDRDYYKYFLSNIHDPRMHIGIPVRNRVDNNWALHLSQRVPDSQGHLRAVVVASLNISKMEEFYAFAPKDQHRPTSMYLQDGTLIGGVPHRENVIGSIAPEFQTQPSISLSSSGASIQQIQSTSQVVNYALAKTPNFPIWIGVYDDPHDALASWREAAIPILLGSIFMIIMVLATAVYIRNRTQVESALSSALNESENRYLKTLESVMDAIVAIDDQQKIILFNKAAERMFGYLEKEVLGQPLGMLMPRRFEAQHQQHVNGYASSQGEARSMSADGQLEIVGRRKNGQEFPIESSISLVWIGGQQQMTASLRDVTERRKSEKSMASLNRQLRALFQNREKVREDERSHIAKELHDDLGQQLTGLRLDMSWALNRVRDGKSLDLNRLNEMRASLDQTVTSVRKISSELRPRYLDDLGLGEAISNLANDFLLRAGLRVELRIDQQAQTMVTPTLTPVYRLLQEALNNIVKHAQASQVEIELSCVNKQGILKIKDDGIGFETSRSSNGIGLLSMRERATALGADFKVISSPGAGTVIEMIWQLEFKNTIES